MAISPSFLLFTPFIVLFLSVLKKMGNQIIMSQITADVYVWGVEGEK